ncbi:hypothetical protein Dsin_022236 [Dipteronia sinensis]|uniref:RNase H type-1 domain-containing protein n=1 Tax=Dipteronia sinensis TaxID=43782 RepID=A0AAE0DZR6_9ROSI|nr:hypothetical protein Dsin_022236 [Dipteronia sinensis]
MLRACNDFLPTNLCLAKRKIPIDLKCPLCKCKDETILHALWGCRFLKVARSRWTAVKEDWYKGNSHFFDFILQCFSFLNSDERGLLCVVLWRTWSNRNAVVHGLPFDASEDIFEWANLFVRNGKAASSVLNTTDGHENKQSKIWEPPAQGLYKINCDAAIDLAGCLVGCGVVIRNEEGLIMAASSQRMMASFPPHIAEATAILCGIQLAIDSGLNPVIVESDAAVVVEWINGGDILYSEIGVIISNIKNLLQQIHCAAVAFVPRSANQVAHCLAKYALSCNEDRYWLEEVPICANKLVVAECRTSL